MYIRRKCYRAPILKVLTGLGITVVCIAQTQSLPTTKTPINTPLGATGAPNRVPAEVTQFLPDYELMSIDIKPQAIAVCVKAVKSGALKLPVRVQYRSINVAPLKPLPDIVFSMPATGGFTCQDFLLPNAERENCLTAIAIIDHDKTIKLANRTKDSKVAHGKCVPDFVITKASAKRQIAGDQSANYSIDYCVKNIGGPAKADFFVRFANSVLGYGRGVPTHGGIGSTYAHISPPHLNMSEVRCGKITFTVTANAVNHIDVSQRPMMIADHTKVIDESNEENNSMSATP